MAAKKIKPAKGKGVLKGKLPTKRSINLVLVDENKINPLTAILGILLIVVLAGVFSKFLVIDRLDAMSRAQGRVTQLQNDLDSAMDALDNIGDIGETYAHYTLEGMTATELNQVDRVLVLALVDSILPVVEEGPSEEEIAGILKSMFRDAPATGNDALDTARQRARLDLLEQLVPVPEYIVNRWSLTDNLLTLEVNGQTLERLNELRRQIEKSPIVDSCAIMTANKDARRNAQEGVWARFIVYLQRPDGELTAEDVAIDNGEKKSLLDDMKKVTQFVGGDVSQQ
ncbi:MAG: hypothetical protein IJI26_09610 [Clostridia bacterium]|nr:hypothetical protein [Clostridia bacterium]